MIEFKPTETHEFFFGATTVKVHIENSNERFAWQMEVNGSKSHVTSYFEGLLVHKGFGLATAYWEGSFKEFVPFKIEYAIAL